MTRTTATLPPDFDKAVAIYKETKDDYQYDPSVFCPDAPEVSRLKWVVQHRLEENERILVILYAEIGSYRKMADMLGVTRSTLFDEMQRIRRKVAEALNEQDNAPDA